jgi:beta-phosphoglucomutase-like phosphatase (HAD superfamily)
MKTILINVENILTDYVPQAIHFWQRKANEINHTLPDDFIESFLSAGTEMQEKTFFRFPHFKQFALDSDQLLFDVHQQINDDNLTIQKLLLMQQKHNLDIGFIYDQKKTQAQHISTYLEDTFNPIIQLYQDDAFLGKPEANILSKARALCQLKANDTLVLDASKNGILAAFLANMRGIYLDKGCGVSERVFKYSYRMLEELTQLEEILTPQQ